MGDLTYSAADDKNTDRIPKQTDIIGLVDSTVAGADQMQGSSIAKLSEAVTGQRNAASSLLLFREQAGNTIIDVSSGSIYKSTSNSYDGAVLWVNPSGAWEKEQGPALTAGDDAIIGLTMIKKILGSSGIMQFGDADNYIKMTDAQFTISNGAGVTDSLDVPANSVVSQGAVCFVFTLSKPPNRVLTLYINALEVSSKTLSSAFDTLAINDFVRYGSSIGDMFASGYYNFQQGLPNDIRNAIQWCITTIFDGFGRELWSPWNNHKYGELHQLLSLDRIYDALSGPNGSIVEHRPDIGFGWLSDPTKTWGVADITDNALTVTSGQSREFTIGFTHAYGTAIRIKAGFAFPALPSAGKIAQAGIAFGVTNFIPSADNQMFVAVIDVDENGVHTFKIFDWWSQVLVGTPINLVGVDLLVGATIILETDGSTIVGAFVVEDTSDAGAPGIITGTFTPIASADQIGVYITDTGALEDVIDKKVTLFLAEPSSVGSRMQVLPNTHQGI